MTTTSTLHARWVRGAAALVLLAGALLGGPTLSATAATEADHQAATDANDRTDVALRKKTGRFLENGCRYTPRGFPRCGVYVGAAHGSNSDPTALEGELGRRLSVRRTYFTATGVDKAVQVARQDVAAGRVPWVSFKLPYTWGDMAAGRGDAWARNLTAELAAVPGPVWVAFHHEPEGDGDIQQWRAMQERLAPIVRGGATNIAFTVVVTGWHQFFGDPQYRLSEIWPRGVKVDLAGFDIYQQYGVVRDGSMTTRWTDMGDYFRRIDTWAEAQGVRWGLSETGVTDVAAEVRPGEMANTVSLMASLGGVAYTYFDTTLNSIASWALSSTAKRASFAKALQRSTAIGG